MAKENSYWYGAALALIFATGCAHEQAQSPQKTQATSAGQSLSPTSDRPEPRVYADLPPAAAAQTAPKGASSEDWVLAEEIRGALIQDRTLAGAPMQAYVDKGVVTLRGYARSESERKRLHDAIAGLPGVKNINDQLEIRGSIFGWGGVSR